jgi:hypothetical protein
MKDQILADKAADRAAASPEHLRYLKNKLAILQKNNRPYYRELTFTDIAVVNSYGIPNFIDAKVMQVVDKDKLIVSVEDAKLADGYRKWIILKVPTKGISVGDTWQTWDKLLGKNPLVVTGTTKYQTTDGGTKTVPGVELLDVGSVKSK